MYLVEVAPAKTPVLERYLGVTDEVAPEVPVEVVAPFAETHWGTREMSVRDPDGRILKLESPGT